MKFEKLDLSRNKIELNLILFSSFPKRLYILFQQKDVVTE